MKLQIAASKSNPSTFIRVEAEALFRLADRLEGAMRPAVDHTIGIITQRSAEGRRVGVTGVGKSGLIARKIAATFSSTGTPAFFLHPSEALHGDLGMLAAGDPVIALSYSGETEEILRLLPAFTRLGNPVIALTGCLSSTLAGVAVATLDVSVDEEACSLNLAPTASTTVMLALGDAIALEIARRSGFAARNFADLHPGGRLGRRLARVRDLMHTGTELPQVAPHTPMSQVIDEMSRTKLGMTTVLDPSTAHPGSFTLAGVLSDGDLRRLLIRVGPHALDRVASDVMNRDPQTIEPNAFASEALGLMEQKKITSLVVVERGLVQGVVHLHDLWHLTPR